MDVCSHGRISSTFYRKQFHKHIVDNERLRTHIGQSSRCFVCRCMDQCMLVFLWTWSNFCTSYLGLLERIFFQTVIINHTNFAEATLNTLKKEILYVLLFLYILSFYLDKCCYENILTFYSIVACKYN